VFWYVFQGLWDICLTWVQALGNIPVDTPLCSLYTIQTPHGLLKTAAVGMCACVTGQDRTLVQKKPHPNKRKHGNTCPLARSWAFLTRDFHPNFAKSKLNLDLAIPILVRGLNI